MFKHGRKITVTLAAIAAMALGAGAVAQAGATNTNKAQAAEKVTLPDRDTVQSGDQTTPDTPGASSAQSAPEPGGNAPEKAGAESPEKAGAESSESALSDGPGGHADSNTAADTQQEGVN